MEDIPSSNESEGGDTDESNREKEEELYSVLHYNDFSQGVPSSLLQKYRISTNKNNEFVISFKNSIERATAAAEWVDADEPATERFEEALTRSSPLDSSDDDVIVIEPSSFSVKMGSSDGGVECVSKEVCCSVDHIELASTSKTNNDQLTKRYEELNHKLGSNPRKRYREDDLARKSIRNATGSEAEPKMIPNPKKKKSAGDDEHNPRTSSQELHVNSKTVSHPDRRGNSDLQANSNPTLKSATEVVIEDNSDSDDSSCVIVEEPDVNRKISISSTESSIAAVLNYESEDEVSGFSLNTTGNLSYDSDGNVSDVIEKSNFDWKEVASPSSWTLAMRKYYNSSCERLRYFDHKQIREIIRTGNRKDWHVSPRDLFPNRRPQQRCLICRQTDHLARNCPKKDPTCHMCGVEGHSNVNCPNSICLQCGRRNQIFTIVCRSCSHTLNRECFCCKQTGHESKACPEKWREFHSTTAGPLRKDKGRNSQPPQCCNCGQTTHSYRDCNQQSMAHFTKSLPAYNWLFGRDGAEDWRMPYLKSPIPSRHHPRSKARYFRDRRDSITDGIPRWTPIKAKKKKKKKKPNPRHSF